MPKALHDKLAREATKKGLKGKRKKAYVFGTINKIQKQTGMYSDDELDQFVAKYKKK